MPQPDILYTSDLHGSRTHYQEAFRLAAELGVRAVVLGGDLAPMGDPSVQREFFDSFLIPLLRDRLGAPDAPEVHYIFGNGDWRANETRLEEAAIAKLHYLHGRAAPFLDGTWIAGQNCVPPTPIRIKDWERWEGSGAGARRDGVRSAPDSTLHPFTFAGRERAESLEAEMEMLEASVRGAIGNARADAGRGAGGVSRLVCVFHGPPHGTALDQLEGGAHVGSPAVRRWIERLRPGITLHGHIHESPTVSGQYADRIGPTLCVNPGQAPSAFHAVTFRLEDIAGSLRHTIFGPAEPRIQTAV